MWLIIVFGIMLIFGIVLNVMFSKFGDWKFIVAIAMTITGGFVVVIALIVWIVQPYQISIKLNAIEQQRSFIENRDDYSEIERAQFFGQMIEFNTELLELKQTNQSPWLGMFIPDEIDDFEPLK